MDGAAMQSSKQQEKMKQNLQIESIGDNNTITIEIHQEGARTSTITKPPSTPLKELARYHLSCGGTLKEWMDECKISILYEAMEQCDDQESAAKMLGLAHRTYLNHLLKKHRILEPVKLTEEGENLLTYNPDLKKG